MAAYFQMVNDQGGVNGRPISFIFLYDGFSPSKTVEQTRRSVQNDNVACIYGTMGTAPSSAIQKYLNVAKIPHNFLINSTSKWNDPKNSPWSIAFPWQPTYASEAVIYLRYLRAKARRSDRDPLSER
jgi:ABC-type branched-subunit amino acid transport system substrate-binding protein